MLARHFSGVGLQVGPPSLTDMLRGDPERTTLSLGKVAGAGGKFLDGAGARAETDIAARRSWRFPASEMKPHTS
jgi:hypothetical protein